MIHGHFHPHDEGRNPHHQPRQANAFHAFGKPHGLDAPRPLLQARIVERGVVQLEAAPAVERLDLDVQVGIEIPIVDALVLVAPGNDRLVANGKAAGRFHPRKDMGQAPHLFVLERFVPLLPVAFPRPIFRAAEFAGAGPVVVADGEHVLDQIELFHLVAVDVETQTFVQGFYFVSEFMHPMAKTSGNHPSAPMRIVVKRRFQIRLAEEIILILACRRQWRQGKEGDRRGWAPPAPAQTLTAPAALLVARGDAGA